MSTSFPDNEIHPTAIIEGDVRMGTRNRIGPWCQLIGPIELGDDNVIGPGVTIGCPPADRRQLPDPDAKRVRIGSRNVIREGSAIQKPLHHDWTVVGDDTYLMQSANLSHDVELGDHVVLSAHVSLAGRAVVLDGANLGMGVSVHQRQVVGHGCMIATNAAVVRNIPPGTYIPGKALKPNPIGLQRAGLDATVIEEVVAWSLANVEPADPGATRIVDRWIAAHEASTRSRYVLA